MITSHFYALIPLIIFLIISMIWYGRGLLHVLLFSYNATLAWFAIVNTWEIIFFPVCLAVAVISVLLFIFSMLKGDWL